MSLEFASLRRGSASGTEAVIRRAPPAVLRAINRKRVAAGLDAVRPVHHDSPLRDFDAEAADEAADRRHGPGVWTRGPGGALQRVGATPPRTTARNSSPRTLVPFRMIIAPAYGDAQSTREHLTGENISPLAFGKASDLNASAGRWGLKWNHDGPALAMNGDSLRAIDSAIGPLLVWEPDGRMPMLLDVVRALEANRNSCGVSVGMVIRRSRPSRITRGTDIVQAELRHVALLLDGRAKPVYPAACGLLRRSVWRDDPKGLQDHIDAVIRECRFRHRRACQA